jgi:K+ transporter
MATIALDAKPIEKQSLRQLALMAFTTLGVIYSDIGTSPLCESSVAWKLA